ncbi:hypothetical protein Tco_1080807 [Tanacetum coccineum]|uniref:Uncharacterized protein n=1 Tax=Tanacetum coccineum TaxID=301880 RepID=A0ABQ5HXD0_9ASTR
MRIRRRTPRRICWTYPANGGDGDDEPFDDDDDDDIDDEDEEPFEDKDDDEEEEHLAPTDSSAIPVVDPVPLAGDTEAFETDEAMNLQACYHHLDGTRARCLSDPRTVYLPSEAEIPSPPLPHPPLSLHLPPPVPTSLSLPSSPLPPLPASLSIPPPVDHREDNPEAELPPRKRLCLTTPTSRNEVGESLTAAPRPTGGHRADYEFIATMDAEIRRQRAEEVGYGIRDVWVDLAEVVEEVAPMTLEGVNARVTKLDAEYRTHTQIQDYRIASQESLTTTLIAHISLLHGQLSAALRQIQALQARYQTHVDDPEGAGSSS